MLGRLPDGSAEHCIPLLDASVGMAGDQDEQAHARAVIDAVLASAAPPTLIVRSDGILTSFTEARPV